MDYNEYSEAAVKVTSQQEALALISEWIKNPENLEWAAELAEEHDVAFSVEKDGRTYQYVSLEASGWQPSASCEWEESAQYGYDYGWINGDPT